VTSVNQAAGAKRLVRDIEALLPGAEGPLRFMEVCGTHTMAIAASGLRTLLPEGVGLVSGPGCPVCVTEKGFIDKAVAVGRAYGACLATFGDLIKVPGSEGSLADYRAEGGPVEIIYSPMDLLKLAERARPHPVVFLGVGFETTIPTVAATVKAAASAGVANLFVLPAFKTIHPALKALAPRPNLTGFLLPGHVSAIIGLTCYEYLASDFGKPGVIAGFEPLDILMALRDLVAMAVDRAPAVTNAYRRVVRDQGNITAQRLIEEVFTPADAVWRGLGTIPGSGLRFRDGFARFDAEVRLPVATAPAKDDPRCRCAMILTGAKSPDQCALFGKECVPDDPVGPCMVSSEGACAAYFKYGPPGAQA
jgi:hydrogenase expression/formation protein HypD